ncbi:MAG: sugar phosphate isomerase/epimerase [Clostridiales bacterium]|nr:sugar phosphate isomerase/epimerase [Clostridiales bacterium]
MSFLISAFSDEAGVSLSEQMDALTRNKMAGMEIRGVDGKNVSKLSEKEAENIRAALAAQGLSIWSVGSPIGKVSIEEPFAPHWEAFLHTLAIAKSLGAEVIRIFSFYMPKDKPAETYRLEVMERLSRMVDKAASVGLMLCHENEKGIYGESADCCFDITETVEGMGLVFDPANFIQAGEPVLPAWQKLKRHVRYLHIKDALANGCIVPAGKGIGCIDTLLREYAELGGRRLTLEPHLSVFDGFNGLEREVDAASKLGLYAYASQNEAFDAAADALRELIAKVNASI